MDIYHVWCDLKPGVGDARFAEEVARCQRLAALHDPRLQMRRCPRQ
jgi:hypothetical protein